MRRMKALSVFLLVSLILLGGSVFSEEPTHEMYEPVIEETFEEDSLKKENMEIRGFYREGEEEEEFSVFISAFRSAPVDDVKIEAMKVFASIVNTLSGGDIYVRIFHTSNYSPRRTSFRCNQWNRSEDI